jgi:hypothetical protein
MEQAVSVAQKKLVPLLTTADVAASLSLHRCNVPVVMPAHPYGWCQRPLLPEGRQLFRLASFIVSLGVANHT